MKAPNEGAADEAEQQEVASLVCSVLEATVPQLPSAPCKQHACGRMFEGEQPCPLRPSQYVQVRSRACWRAPSAPHPTAWRRTGLLCRPASRQ